VAEGRAKPTPGKPTKSLLSSDAAVNTKPQLKSTLTMSSAATVQPSAVDADAMFYPFARPGAGEARSLLSFAFASEVIGKMKIDTCRRLTIISRLGFTGIENS
jgi:hypothetical protein